MSILVHTLKTDDHDSISAGIFIYSVWSDHSSHLSLISMDHQLLSLQVRTEKSRYHYDSFNIAWFGIKNGKISPTILLIWNLICLGLLINIVFLALFSAPSPFQKFAFEQPNIALPNFPYVWLPTFIVPLVLFGHLVSIRQLYYIIRRGS
ncbi:hypothetical protein [Pedobacter gandavensis]|uniref:hypothetical protein n=1 Tax=Pedobacter gandavensis TaxID=2679963 RepID=UPI0015FFCE86|nr:hypothetical protein [Pedobacter gandavensis]